MSLVFKLQRRTSSYGHEDLEKWLKENPAQTITISYDPDGFTYAEDDSRKFRAKLGTPKGSRIGWVCSSLPELFQAICEDLP